MFNHITLSSKFEICLILFVCFFVYASTGQARVYQWVDESGNTHFGNVPPSHQKEYRLGSFDKDAEKKAAKKKQLEAKKAKIKKESSKLTEKKAPTKKESEKIQSAQVQEPASQEDTQQSMCSVYTYFVNEYQDKAKNCSGVNCEINKRFLAEYEQKQIDACGE